MAENSLAQLRRPQQNVLGLRPLEPGEFRKNQDGSQSTELSRHMPLPDGTWIMVPSLWMGPSGPVEIGDEDALLRLALEYERETGRTFPRWATKEEALSDPGYRSRQGGIAAGPMATFAPNRSPTPQRRY